MAGVYNIASDQGATWSETWTWLDANGAAVNLTSYTAKMSLVDLTGNVVLALTQLAGIVLGGTAGTIVPTATAAQTAGIFATTYRYDLFLTSPGGVVTRLLAGTFTLNARITP